MRRILVSDIPDHVHEALEQRAGRVGMTTSEYVRHLIDVDLHRTVRSEWLRTLRSLPPTTYSREQVLAHIDAARSGWGVRC